MKDGRDEWNHYTTENTEITEKSLMRIKFFSVLSWYFFQWSTERKLNREVNADLLAFFQGQMLSASTGSTAR